MEEEQNIKNNTNEKSNEIKNKKQEELENNEEKKSDLKQNKNNNNFFNKSLNAINIANNSLNGLNNMTNKMGNSEDLNDKMSDVNETRNALNQMGNKASQNINNATNLVRGINNKIQNQKNKNNKEEKDENNKDNKEKDDKKDKKDKKSSIDDKKNTKKTLSKKDKSKSKKEIKKNIIDFYKKLPISLKIGIISFIFILLFVILFLVIFSIFASSSAYGSSDYCVSDNFDISDLENTSTFTYTGVFDFKWQDPVKSFYEEHETYIDENGFLRTDNDYIIALGTYFGEEKGTRYLITLEDGTTFTAILGDTKSDNHTDETHRFQKYDKSVIEFERGCGTVIDPIEYGFKFAGDIQPTKCSNETEKIRKVFNSNIESIKLLSNNCNYNGIFPERTKEPSNSDIEEATKLAPSIANRIKYECVWYVIIRAVEIINTSNNLTDAQKQAAISDINKTYGNAWQLFPTINSGLKNFGYDDTCSIPKAGSIITQQSGVAHCADGPYGYCGHVMIVESVDNDKKTAIVTDGYNGGGFMNWRRREKKFSELNTNHCIGYTYLLEYNN